MKLSFPRDQEIMTFLSELLLSELPSKWIKIVVGNQEI